MKNEIPYFLWPEAWEKITPEERKIPPDVFLSYGTVHPDSSWKPFRMHHTVLTLLINGEYSFEIDGKQYNEKGPLLIVQLKDRVRRLIACSKGATSKVIILSESFMNELFREVRLRYNLIQTFLRTPVWNLSKENLDLFLSYFGMIEQEVERVTNPKRREAVKYLLIALFSGHLFGRSRNG